jgi:hypothetical protein
VAAVAALAVSALVTLSWQVYGPDDVRVHWEAVFYSVVQIARGAVCLDDVTPQYGCYAEFVRPIVAATGVSGPATMVTFAALQLAGLVLVIAYLFRTVASPVAALAAVVWHLVTFNRVFHHPWPDVYFQYTSLRFLFPAASLGVVLAWQRHPSARAAFLAGAFSGLGVWWNLDVGAVVLVALGVFVVATSGPLRAGRRSAKHAGCFALGAAAALAGFAAYLAARSGTAPDLAPFVSYQRAFFGAGFYMLPMPRAPGYWTIAVVAYALALVAYASSLGGTRSPEHERGAYLALLGSGLLAYFVGRSHPEVFLLAAWPAPFVLSFLVDRAERAFAAAGLRLAAACCRAASALALAIACLILAARAGDLARIAQARWTAAFAPRAPSAADEDAAFIAERSAAGEAVAVLAENQASLLAAAGRRSAVPGPGLAEIVLRSDAERAIGWVLEDGPQHVFVSRGLLSADVQLAVIEPWVRDGYARLAERYAVQAEGPHGRMLHLRRRPE